MSNYPVGFDPETHRNKPICGVLTIAIAAGVSYDKAHELCRQNMPSHRARFRGATYDTQRDAALKQAGIKFTVLKPNISVMKFCDWFAKDGKTYLLQVRGHVMTLKNGFLIDQHICKPWQQYHHPRIKVKRVVRIDQ